MTSEILYDIADRENIEIINYNKLNNEARIMEIDNSFCIFMNPKKINNSIQEKEILAEELGHYFTDTLYYPAASRLEKSKCEYKAQKWAMCKLVPFDALKQKIKQGYNLYDLAEYFDVEPNYMQNCIDLYLSKYGTLV
ncbi:MAG: ImmA/IrrE family metallo-endopeptidase [Monoglobales bacterium]